MSLPLLVKLGALAGAAWGAKWAYARHKAGGGTPLGGFTPPPAIPGYTPPAVPAGTPPSWSYQGPPVAPAPSTSQTVAFVATPGTQTAGKLPAGCTLMVSLPGGASWNASDPLLCPTSIGGDVTGATGSSPMTLTGLSGAGTMRFSWADASGANQKTLFDLST